MSLRTSLNAYQSGSKLNQSRFEKSEKILGHSNLLIINTIEKTISHFEPLNIIEFSSRSKTISTEFKYYILVNNVLRIIMKNTLPNYSFSLCPVHPQSLPNTKRKDKSMCAAYVIYLSCLLVKDKKVIFSSDDKDICKFAKAVESLYKLGDTPPRVIEKCAKIGKCHKKGIIGIFIGEKYIIYKNITN